ncbi:Hypothetical predicted protein [Pelobates cultripes]|uniref:Uncharacterized protein n=1 Tax=Pelobates cultripes TaxID=61616 RepID=A0AAD1S3U7_PELCU|nr:Hypothetical predicted protein [Pelobates cultripes]
MPALNSCVRSFGGQIQSRSPEATMPVESWTQTTAPQDRLHSGLGTQVKALSTNRQITQRFFVSQSFHGPANLLHTAGRSLEKLIRLLLKHGISELQSAGAAHHI